MRHVIEHLTRPDRPELFQLKSPSTLRFCIEHCILTNVPIYYLSHWLYIPSSPSDLESSNRSRSCCAEERGVTEEVGAIDQAHRESARATVKQMLEDDVIDMILEANEGDLGRTIEAMIDFADG